MKTKVGLLIVQLNTRTRRIHSRVRLTSVYVGRIECVNGDSYGVARADVSRLSLTFLVGPFTEWNDKSGIKVT